MGTGVGVARPLDVWDIGDWEIGKSETLKYKSKIAQYLIANTKSLILNP
jgi:hypothetical protein